MNQLDPFPPRLTLVQRQGEYVILSGDNPTDVVARIPLALLSGERDRQRAQALFEALHAYRKITASDTARLDWLESQFNGKFRNSMFIADHLIDDGVMMDCRSAEVVTAPTIRQLIDNARQVGEMPES
jgi:hypothetical protein